MSDGAAGIDATVLDRIGADALATRGAPGFSFIVVREDKVVYAKGFGMADVAGNVAVTPQTRFAVGSITKQFTAASILLLAQRGKLQLGDRLRDVRLRHSERRTEPSTRRTSRPNSRTFSRPTFLRKSARLPVRS